MHTPGPWRLDDGHDGHGRWHYSIGASYQWPEGEAAFCALAFTPPLGVGPYAANRQADARLIAAAPDLLAALKRMVQQEVETCASGDCGNYDCELIPTMIVARAAIAKAEGL